MIKIAFEKEGRFAFINQQKDGEYGVDVMGTTGDKIDAYMIIKDYNQALRVAKKMIGM